MIDSYLDAIPVALAMFNKDREMLYRNSAMEEVMFIHDLDEHGPGFLAQIAGTGADGGKAGSHRGGFRDADKNVLDPKAAAVFDPEISNPEPFNTEIAILGHNGGSNFSLTLQRIDFQALGNNEACAILLLNDITMLTRAKIDALAASRAKTDFLARMSHEIRTPMNVILGMIKIARDSPETEKIRKCLDQVESSTLDLLGTIDDILDFNKIESGKIQLDLAEFSLSSNMNTVISMMNIKARQESKTIKLVMEKIENDAVYADALKLNQVLINLISNAIKFTENGSDVIVKTRELGYMNGFSTYLFEVIDHGIGISEYQASKLFRPFEQADGGITRKYGGTGLGLAISKNLVEMMGGKISLQSREGEGSVFSFTINCASKPELKPETRGTADDEEETFDFSGKRCLIVDDIDINREIVMEFLSKTNIFRETAENGTEAVEIFRAGGPGRFDIILMDMQMPLMDGCTATREIRLIEEEWAKENGSMARQIPIIAMTANVLQEDIQRVMESGMNSHLGKPIDKDITLKTMREYFRSA